MYFRDEINQYWVIKLHVFCILLFAWQEEYFICDVHILRLDVNIGVKYVANLLKCCKSKYILRTILGTEKEVCNTPVNLGFNRTEQVKHSSIHLFNLFSRLWQIIFHYHLLSNDNAQYSVLIFIVREGLQSQIKNFWKRRRPCIFAAKHATWQLRSTVFYILKVLWWWSPFCCLTKSYHYL